MNIVLTGFMGTGKSAVGRRLAEQLHASFVDVDEAIERQAGRAVSLIFESQGEPEFRMLERRAIELLAAQDKSVIATGGGALLDPRNRECLQKNGLLVCLRARTSTLLERLKDDVTRPLLAGENMEARVERLMKERQTVYELCPIQVDTDDKTIAQVADRIVREVGPRWIA